MIYSICVPAIRAHQRRDKTNQPEIHLVALDLDPDLNPHLWSNSNAARIIL